ncbi:hypothetical protein JIN84_18080 [Luteolibacter yonseiensis]|uniref:Transmembrane protein n=1 Tax=Luteolibacter yonseiensis TaxID=1144680 RepID=A0A934VCV6_9BACT|nr:hypothetical protein [Luteolibacter yonseiensis]MBK1817535.1 hypothetical protein [Luteolibacter yonseiensis]
MSIEIETKFSPDFEAILRSIEQDRPVPVDSLPSDVAANGKRDLELQALAQTLALRYWVAGFVGVLLLMELIGLFMIVVWQGRGHFHLGDTVFGFLTTGVLLQTFFSFRTIVTHLFPDGAKEFKN